MSKLVSKQPHQIEKGCECFSSKEVSNVNDKVEIAWFCVINFNFVLHSHNLLKLLYHIFEQFN